MRRLLPGLCFAAAYTQPWAFYSNQHQYYLHAAADASLGFLREDWLANTLDPTPVFTAIVATILRTLGAWPLQVIYFAVLVAYYASLQTLVESLGLLPKRCVWLFAALVTLSHAGIGRYASDRLLGADYFWFFQCGLANQYVLGPGLQPSVAGVLLVMAMAQYAAGRAKLAAALAAVSCLFHATYLLPAAMLICGFAVADRRNRKPVLASAAIAMLIALPAVAFSLIRFGPSDSQLFAQAQSILAFERIPHHTRPARWFDIAAAAQLVLLSIGSILLRGTTLFVVWLVAMALAAAGTMAVIVSDSPTLSLLFPWRISAVLVPAATALLAAKIARRWERTSWLIATVLLAIALGGAAAIYSFHLGYREPAAEDPVLEFVRQHAKPGDCYLIPARFAKPNPPRGVYSNTFTAPPGPDATVHFELARFRLATGAALYVDFKSVPYQDAEVLEWHRRVSRCVDWYSRKTWDAALVSQLRREGITHVVAPRSLDLAPLAMLAEAGAYRVYELPAAK